jgi:hypothetical protein
MNAANTPFNSAATGRIFAMTGGRASQAELSALAAHQVEAARHSRPYGVAIWAVRAIVFIGFPLLVLAVAFLVEGWQAKESGYLLGAAGVVAFYGMVTAVISRAMVRTMIESEARLSGTSDRDIRGAVGTAFRLDVGHRRPSLPEPASGAIERGTDAALESVRTSDEYRQAVMRARRLLALSILVLFGIGYEATRGLGHVQALLGGFTGSLFLGGFMFVMLMTQARSRAGLTSFRWFHREEIGGRSFFVMFVKDLLRPPD